MADETETKVESKTPSQEDYEGLKPQLEAERQGAQCLVAEATRDLTSKIAALEQELALKTQDMGALKDQLKRAQEELEGAKAAYAYAVDDFKRLAAASNPIIPAQAISGSTIDEVKASLATANELVSAVKEAVAEQTRTIAVPAGAPARGAPHLSAMSSREKITLGLEQARKRKET